MKKVKWLVGLVFISLAAFVLLQSACFADDAESNNQLTVEQKLEDFNYAYNIIKDNFPYLEVRKRMTGFDWLAHRAEFECKVRESKNDVEFCRLMGEIVGSLGDGHTALLDYSFEKYFDLNYFIPLTLVYAEGKYLIVDAYKKTLQDYDIPVGSVLLSIDGVNIDEYAKSARHKAYDAARKKVVSNDLMLRTDSAKDITLVMETPDRKQLKKVIKAEKITIDDYTAAIGDTAKPLMATKIMVDKKVAYLKVNMMNWDAVETDGEQIYNFFSEVKDYSYLIIDIRGNPGGTAEYWVKNMVEPLLNSDLAYKAYMVLRNGGQVQQLFNESPLKDRIRTIGELPNKDKWRKKIDGTFNSFIESNITLYPRSDQIDFKGKIYLLIDNEVYSAADIFASFAKSTRWATLVGTNISGDGVGYETGQVFLPNSKYELRFATSLGMSDKGTINCENPVQADVYIEPSVNDTIKGIAWRKQNRDELINPYDTVLNKLLGMLK